MGLADIMNMLTNQHSYAIKKYTHELIKDRYPQHEELLTRVCSSLVTENDVEGFAKLMADLYECGFLKAMEESRDALEAAGYKMSITPPKEQTEDKRIFPN